VGGIQDQIDDGENGLLLADPCDLEAFGALVRRALDDPELADRLGEGARVKAASRFLVVQSIQRYARLIDSLIDQPSSNGHAGHRRS
jgi:trehalose synthase